MIYEKYLCLCILLFVNKAFKMQINKKINKNIVLLHSMLHMTLVW